MGRRRRGRGVAGAAVAVARVVTITTAATTTPRQQQCASAVAADATRAGRRGVADALDASETTAAAASARRHAVAAGVAEASVRTVRLCAESGGLVVIAFVFYSSSPTSLFTRSRPGVGQLCYKLVIARSRVAITISAPVTSPLVPPDQDASKSYAKVPAATRV